MSPNHLLLLVLLPGLTSLSLGVLLHTSIHTYCNNEQYHYSLIENRVRIIPDFVTSASGDRVFNYSFSGVATYSPLYTQPFTLYDDEMAIEYETYRFGTSPASGFNTASTDILPHSGNYTISMLMAKRYSYGIRGLTSFTGASINPRFVCYIYRLSTISLIIV